MSESAVSQISPERLTLDTNHNLILLFAAAVCQAWQGSPGRWMCMVYLPLSTTIYHQMDLNGPDVLGEFITEVYNNYMSSIWNWLNMMIDT